MKQKSGAAQQHEGEGYLQDDEAGPQPLPAPAGDAATRQRLQAGALEGRCEAEKQPGQQADADGGEEDAAVETGLLQPGNTGRRGGRKEPEQSSGQGGSGGTADGAQEQAFGE